MSHTPGPWIRSSFGFQVLTADSHNAICEIYPPSGDPDRRVIEEHIANADLIAAAPELLEACKAMLMWLGERSEEEEWPYDKAKNALIDQIESAINKAY